jgi:hypothetical protein
MESTSQNPETGNSSVENGNPENQAVTPQPEVVSAELQAAAELTEPTTEPVAELPATPEPVAEIAEAPDPEIHEEEKQLQTLASVADEDQEAETEPIENFGQLSKEELLQRMEVFAQESDLNSVKNRIQATKDAFQTLVQHEKDAMLAAFLENGGIKEEFEPRPDPIEESFFELYKKYNKRRTDFVQSQEKIRQDNFKAKQEILQQMKNILQQEEDMSRAFNEFHALQARWRSIGPVPPQSVNDLWMTYKLYSDRFYEFIKINRELQDLEMKKNLEMKMHLCERAEELMLEPSLNKALQEGQALQHKWREIGAVPREKRTEIWLRFKGAIDKIFEQKRQHLDSQKQHFEQNLKLKTELCEKAEELIKNGFEKHTDWQDGLKKVLELQTEWRKIGPAGKEQNDAIWQRFKTTCDQFFKNKDQFYKKRKQEYAANLQQKTELCIQAEALKESDDWKTTTNELVRLQQEWKKIGPAGDKNEKIWQRFKTACDAFFNRKSEHFADQGSQQEENLKQKEALIQEVLAYQLAGEASEALEHLKDFQRKFTGIGLVPMANKDDIQTRFRNAVQTHFDSLKSSPGYRRPAAPRSGNDRPRERRDYSTASQPQGSDEQRNLMNKVSKLSSEVSTLENNLGFFANSKNASALRQEYEQKIQEAKNEIAKLKSRLTELRNA